MPTADQIASEHSSVYAQQIIVLFFSVWLKQLGLENTKQSFEQEGPKVDVALRSLLFPEFLKWSQSVASRKWATQK